MKIVYPAVFSKKEDGSGYRAFFPDLEGCEAEGLELEDAADHAREAATDWILVEMDEGNDLPELSHEEDLTLEEGSIVKYLTMTIQLVPGYD
ncbi:MAG: type II toxin-antitoxin system HicB family antitoxin [Lachnospiraceae bacterium]|nr:type II toxin-antitoxin system HicB family antitoxin [Lachnospiraceae bacterium]